MSDGLPQPHLQAVCDGSSNVGDGLRCREHYTRPADTSTDSEEVISYLVVVVFLAQSTTRVYIKAEGDFHKEIYS